MKNNFEFLLKDIEKGRARVIFEGEEFILPSKIIPRAVVPTQKFFIASITEQDQLQNAKDILSELLGKN